MEIDGTKRDLENGLRFKIKVPQTLDQAAKLRSWLEGILHTLSGKAHRHASNLIYQVKATEDEADLLREQKQAQFAWQAERLKIPAPVSVGPQ